MAASLAYTIAQDHPPKITHFFHAIFVYVLTCLWCYGNMVLRNNPKGDGGIETLRF
jgi:hypothetical protein